MAVHGLYFNTISIRLNYVSKNIIPIYYFNFEFQDHNQFDGQEDPDAFGTMCTFFSVCDVSIITTELSSIASFH